MMKFTEEQYQKIVEIAYEYQINSCFGIMGDTTQKSIGAEFYETDLSEEIDFYENSKEIMAIVNPLTREWAHEKFVEKESEYYWTSKKEDDAGFAKRLYKDDDGMIVDHVIRKEDPDKAEDEQLTESEIKAWGYNPEMFDREEVQ
ncbi:hypothetical protein [Leuconostoc mesenteroides]|uniref:hypothetical protein n=1 Tax=Leuconostoc mesenteroides TaxID=1245 RepID=UPI002360347E|nr:hypothetical protein [Leuconostoc mesenteroides]